MSIIGHACVYARPHAFMCAFLSPDATKKKKIKASSILAGVCEMQRSKKRRRVDCYCKIQNPCKEVMPFLLCDQFLLFLANLYVHILVDPSCFLDVNSILTSIIHPSLYNALLLCHITAALLSTFFDKCSKVSYKG